MDCYHSKKIAHRDLKADNIVVNMQSSEFNTKIIDFEVNLQIFITA